MPKGITTNIQLQQLAKYIPYFKSIFMRTTLSMMRVYSKRKRYRKFG